MLLSGCATSANPKDPFEKFNRAVFTFNDAVDRTALKPAATAYKNVTPDFVQTGVNNFFGNLSDLWSSANNFAQLKGRDGMNDFTRFALNSTLGLVGVLDIATPAGLRKHNEDLGQTLGYWGVPSGPYLMLPLLGPSTIRDTAALPGDFWGDAWTHVNTFRGATAASCCARSTSAPACWMPRTCSKTPPSTATNSSATVTCSAATARSWTRTRPRYAPRRCRKRWTRYRKRSTGRETGQ